MPLGLCYIQNFSGYSVILIAKSVPMPHEETSLHTGRAFLFKYLLFVSLSRMVLHLEQPLVHSHAPAASKVSPAQAHDREHFVSTDMPAGKANGPEISGGLSTRLFVNEFHII